MSQNASVDPTMWDRSVEEAKHDPPMDQGEGSGGERVNYFSIDTYAEGLMDELFDDLDRMLERGVALTPTPPSPPSTPAATPPTATTSGLVLSATLVPEKSSPSDDAGAVIPRLDDDADLDLFSASDTPIEPSRRPGKSVDTLLLLLVGVSLIAVAVLWLVLRDRWQGTIPMTTSALPSPERVDAPAQNEDTAFLAYVERSLDAIERKTAENEAIASTPGLPGPPSSLPQVTVSANPPSTASPSPVERVYVPIYQPPQVTALPTTPTLPSIAVAPAPVAPVPGAPSSTTPTRPPNIAPTSTHLLVGLLESSDPSRSAALFEINGTSQRVQVGEAIGSSGWTLVSVDDQEALVRRNGEVRSIYVGQQF